MPPRKRKPRPTYREHSEATVNRDIQARITDSGPFWDWLTEERLIENFGTSEFERGVVEGARRFAGRLQSIVMGEFDEKRDV